MSTVCESWNRFVLICKPEQSGKTFIMIQNIIKDLREPVDDRVVVNVILCDNNLLLTQQTGNRVAQDLEEFECNGESYIEFSSHKRTKYHDACSVAGAITTRNIKNVLCCTNGVRIEDIYTIVSDINNGRFTKSSTAKSEAVVKCEEYWISTRLQSIIGKKKDALVAADRLTIETANHITDSFGISSNKGTRYLILPVYPTMEASPRQVEYEVRYIKFK